MFTGIGLYIVVMLNGQEWEAVPQVFPTLEECLVVKKEYTKDIVIESECFKGTFKAKS